MTKENIIRSQIRFLFSKSMGKIIKKILIKVEFSEARKVQVKTFRVSLNSTLNQVRKY